jgi:hypothetical protein
MQRRSCHFLAARPIASLRPTRGSGSLSAMNLPRYRRPCRRVRRQRECHLYFARRVSFLSCADIDPGTGTEHMRSRVAKVDEFHFAVANSQTVGATVAQPPATTAPPLGVMIVNGSKARARRPRRSSRLNGNPPSHRTPRRPARSPAGESFNRQGRCEQGLELPYLNCAIQASRRKGGAL